MSSRSQTLDWTTTPDGEPVELALEGGHYVIRVAGVALMSSAASGSERALAQVAAQHLGPRRNARVLIGGLGMGYTLRAALDAFDASAEIVVAELLPAVVGYNLGVLGPLAGHPLSDRRVTLFEGDVRTPLIECGWDAVLMDVDNGPDAFTAFDNANLYTAEGVALMARALAPCGVLIVWSAYPSASFERRLRDADLHCETRRVRIQGATGKGSHDTLFVAWPLAESGK